MLFISLHVTTSELEIEKVLAAEKGLTTIAELITCNHSLKVLQEL